MADEQSTRIAHSPWLIPGLLALVVVSVAGASALFAADYHSPEPLPETLPEVHSGMLEPFQPPEKPADLTSENVTEFVRRTEYVRTYNRHREGNGKISLTCEANLTEETENGFYVVAGCGGWTSNGAAVGDFSSPSIPYFVNETETVRIGRVDSRHRPTREIYASDDSAENVQPPNRSAAGFRVYNFDDRRRTVSVTVTYLNESEPERVLAAEYDLEPASGIEQDDVTVRRGAYRIEVRLEAGETLTHRWTVDGSRGYSWAKTAIFVTPTGEVMVVKLPIFSLGPL